MQDTGKLVLRVTLGVLILFHGVAKITGGVDPILGMVAKAGLPPALGYLAYVGEVIAPVLLIVGLWTRAAAVIVAINMAVGVALFHAHEIFTMSEMGGWALELQGMFLFAAVAVMLLGAGRLSMGGAKGRLN